MIQKLSKYTSEVRWEKTIVTKKMTFPGHAHLYTRAAIPKETQGIMFGIILAEESAGW